MTCAACNGAIRPLGAGGFVRNATDSTLRRRAEDPRPTYPQHPKPYSLQRNVTGVTSIS